MAAPERRQGVSSGGGCPALSASWGGGPPWEHLLEEPQAAHNSAIQEKCSVTSQSSYSDLTPT